MGRSEKRLVIGTGIGLIVAATIGALSWVNRDREGTAEAAVLKTPAISETASQAAVQDLEASDEEIGRLKADGRGTARQLSELNGKLVAVSAQLAQLQQQVARRKAAEPNATDAGSNGLDADSQVQSPEEQVEKAEAQIREQATLIESTVEQENADHEWAGSAELALNKMFRSDEVNTLSLARADCRTTVCRIEITAAGSTPDATTFEQQFRKLIHLAPWQGQGFAHVDNSDPSAPLAVLYLARAGGSLPQLVQQE